MKKSIRKFLAATFASVIMLNCCASASATNVGSTKTIKLESNATAVMQPTVTQNKQTGAPVYWQTIYLGSASGYYAYSMKQLTFTAILNTYQNTQETVSNSGSNTTSISKSSIHAAYPVYATEKGTYTFSVNATNYSLQSTTTTWTVVKS